MTVFSEELTCTEELLESRIVYVAEGDSVIDYYSLNRTNPETVDLAYLFVPRESFGQGIGRSLFEHAGGQLPQPVALRARS